MSAPRNISWLYRSIDMVLRTGLRLLPPWNSAERIALWWGYRFRPASRRVSLRSGALVQIDGTDYLQLLLYYMGTFEPHVLSCLRRSVGRGATVIDVGANIGVFTLESALVVGSTGRVISIEAAPCHVRALQGNVRLNCLHNVRIVEAAAWDETGEGSLEIPKGGNLGMFAVGVTDGEQPTPVALRTIDSLLEAAHIYSVDLMKMDIEGAEYRALRGATGILMRDRPILIVELNQTALSRCGSSPRDIEEFLTSLGYRGWLIGRHGFEDLSHAPASHVCDECLFLPSERKQLIRRLGLSN